MTQREVELVRRTFTTPADPGTDSTQYAIVGVKGAVSFNFLDWTENATPEQRAIDTEWVIRHGHPLYPLGEDLAYHAREPIHEEGWADSTENCHLLDAPCWYDGSTLNAVNLLTWWIQRDRDMEWLWHYLAGYYHDVFYGDDDD